MRSSKFQKKKVGCIRIDGKTAAASRQALVTDFQEKDAIKAAVVCQFVSFIYLPFIFVP
jgi:SNF2 family DNA or RNA helicase